MERPVMLATLFKNGVKLTDSFAFRPDADTERAFLFWVHAGSPKNVRIRMDTMKGGTSQTILTDIKTGKEVARG